VSPAPTFEKGTKMDICEKLRWMADKHCNELIEAAEEIEWLREERKSYSAAVESLDAEVTAQRRAANEHRNAAMEADLRTQAAVRGEKQLEGKLTAVTRWLEANQPDVFKRGLWDAIDAPIKPTTLCWRCNTAYPMADMQCQSCGATNANRDPETAAIEVRAKKFDRGGQRNENNEGDPL
jgi:hypothetical protein